MIPRRSPKFIEAEVVTHALPCMYIYVGHRPVTSRCTAAKMTEEHHSPPPLIPFHTTRHRGWDAIEHALHRRGNEWYVVFTRGYGMAYSRCVGQISSPGESSSSSSPSSWTLKKKASATHDPPSSKPHLNPRFWLRDGRDFEPSYFGSELLDFDTLFSTEPRVLADTGMRRTRKCGEKDVEERLVEVIVKEEGISQRCATCGEWESTYHCSARHQKVGEDGDGMPIYWCGVSLHEGG